MISTGSQKPAMDSEDECDTIQPSQAFIKPGIKPGIKPDIKPGIKPGNNLRTKPAKQQGDVTAFLKEKEAERRHFFEYTARHKGTGTVLKAPVWEWSANAKLFL